MRKLKFLLMTLTALVCSSGAFAVSGELRSGKDQSIRDAVNQYTYVITDDAVKLTGQYPYYFNAVSSAIETGLNKVTIVFNAKIKDVTELRQYTFETETEHLGGAPLNIEIPLSTFAADLNKDLIKVGFKITINGVSTELLFTAPKAFQGSLILMNKNESDVIDGPVFYTATAKSQTGAWSEAQKAQLVLKQPKDQWGDAITNFSIKLTYGSKETTIGQFAGTKVVSLSEVTSNKFEVVYTANGYKMTNDKNVLTTVVTPEAIQAAINTRTSSFTNNASVAGTKVATAKYAIKFPSDSTLNTTATTVAYTVSCTNTGATVGSQTGNPKEVSFVVTAAYEGEKLTLKNTGLIADVVYNYKADDGNTAQFDCGRYEAAAAADAVCQLPPSVAAVTLKEATVDATFKEGADDEGFIGTFSVSIPDLSEAGASLKVNVPKVTVKNFTITDGSFTKVFDDFNVDPGTNYAATLDGLKENTSYTITGVVNATYKGFTYQTIITKTMKTTPGFKVKDPALSGVRGDVKNGYFGIKIASGTAANKSYVNQTEALSTTALTITYDVKKGNTVVIPVEKKPFTGTETVAFAYDTYSTEYTISGNISNGGTETPFKGTFQVGEPDVDITVASYVQDNKKFLLTVTSPTVDNYEAPLNAAIDSIVYIFNSFTGAGQTWHKEGYTKDADTLSIVGKNVNGTITFVAPAAISTDAVYTASVTTKFYKKATKITPAAEIIMTGVKDKELKFFFGANAFEIPALKNVTITNAGVVEVAKFDVCSENGAGNGPSDLINNDRWTISANYGTTTGTETEITGIYSDRSNTKIKLNGNIAIPAVADSLKLFNGTIKYYGAQYIAAAAKEAKFFYVNINGTTQPLSTTKFTNVPRTEYKAYPNQPSVSSWVAYNNEESTLSFNMPATLLNGEALPANSTLQFIVSPTALTAPYNWDTAETLVYDGSNKVVSVTKPAGTYADDSKYFVYYRAKNVNLPKGYSYIVNGYFTTPRTTPIADPTLGTASSNPNAQKTGATITVPVKITGMKDATGDIDLVTELYKDGVLDNTETSRINVTADPQVEYVAFTKRALGASYTIKAKIVLVGSQYNGITSIGDTLTSHYSAEGNITTCLIDQQAPVISLAYKYGATAEEGIIMCVGVKNPSKMNTSNIPSNAKVTTAITVTNELNEKVKEFTLEGIGGTLSEEIALITAEKNYKVAAVCTMENANNTDQHVVNASTMIPSPKSTIALTYDGNSIVKTVWELAAFSKELVDNNKFAFAAVEYQYLYFTDGICTYAANGSFQSKKYNKWYNLNNIVYANYAYSVVLTDKKDYAYNGVTFTTPNATFQRSFTVNKYVGFCVPFEAELNANATAYYLTSARDAGNNKIALDVEEKSQSLKPFMPYIGKSATGGVVTFTGKKTNGVTTIAAIPDAAALATDTYTFACKTNKGVDVAFYSTLSALTSNANRYAFDGNGEMKKNLGTIGAFRTYLVVKGWGTEYTIGFRGFDDDATLIENGEVNEFTVMGGNFITIAAPEATPVRIYSADGKLVRTLDAECGYNYVYDLANGMYIVNGVKVLVK